MKLAVLQAMLCGQAFSWENAPMTNMSVHTKPQITEIIGYMSYSCWFTQKNIRENKKEDSTTEQLHT